MNIGLLSKQEIARELLPLLEQFEVTHQGEPSFTPGQPGYVALRRLIFNVQYDAEQCAESRMPKGN